VKIDCIRTQKGWNFQSCGGEKCKKGVCRRREVFGVRRVKGLLKEVVEEDVRSGNVNTYPDINIKQSKRLATKPIVTTPSKPTEERGKKVQLDLEDSDEEVTCGMDDGQTDGKTALSQTKGRKRGTLWTILPL
nr:hypothetical protein [Tanacetum cinerariifolium]